MRRGGAREQRIEQLLGSFDSGRLALATTESHATVVRDHRVEPVLEVSDLVVDECRRQVLVDLHHRVLGVLAITKVVEAQS